ncbi:hypothetical protein F5B19DRAFT_81146 [Rostrohypoxylon terebratum]|nr:hypothetical protein F5B19DRAFT_81146 [Rostrohypoxylon terebratum]
MFERISMRLPYFAHHIAHFRERKKRQPEIERHSNIAHHLACMYECIIQFCKEACHVFTKKRTVIFGRGPTIELLWKPFDAKFSDVISRLEQCTERYQLELDLADREELMGHYQKFDQFLLDAQRDNDRRQSQHREQKTRSLHEQVRCIKTWIDAPDYMSIFEQKAPLNASGKKSWFLEDDQYKTWRQSWIQLDNNGGETLPIAPPASGTLCVYGPPGYGKTVLSTIAIQDLTSEESTIPNTTSRKVAFFHFNKLNELSKKPFHAMRAVLIQLLHKSPDDRKLVDAASILMDVTGSGQQNASELEVASLLELFFNWHPSTALIFDGVDECSDPPMFLNQLHTLCSLSRCKILLFSRPNLALPMVLRHTCQQLNLQHGANHHDIRSFVQPRLEALVRFGDLPPLDVISATKEIADRSNSLFLWAKLMMDYLDSPALSQRDRLSAISRLEMLEGLEPLFTEILEMIKRKYKQEINTAYMTFSWILVARQPLKLLELQTGLAIKLNRRTVPESDYIRDFRRSIIRICGALVEVRGDSTVHFIHLSVRDFLTNLTSTTPKNISRLLIPLPTVRIIMASLCLAYIIHNVPRGPLSGSTSVKVHLPAVESRLLFLKHAVDWPHHIAKTLETPNALKSSPFRNFPRFYSIIETFLQTKSIMTVWLESVWAFDRTTRICEATKKIQGYALTANIARLVPVGEKLGSLVADFEYLRREWSHVLNHTSGEIWAPSSTSLLR